MRRRSQRCAHSGTSTFRAATISASSRAQSAQLEQLKAAFKAVGKKLEMGKCCVHFKSPDDLPVDAVVSAASRADRDLTDKPASSTTLKAISQCLISLSRHAR